MSLWEGFVRWWQGSTPPGEEDAQALEDEAAILKGRLNNRSVLVVRPREPFRRWAVRVNGEKLDEASFAEDHTAYLIPIEYSVEVSAKSLELLYERIFEIELLMVNLDRKKWPARHIKEPEANSDTGYGESVNKRLEIR